MQYPHLEHDELLFAAGSFWPTLYEGDIFSRVVQARSIVEAQATEDREGLKACASRATTPIYSRLLWMSVPVQRNKSTIIANNIVSIPLLTDQIEQPTVVLIEGIDYILSKHTLQFATNIFNYMSLNITPVLDGAGQATDTAVVLWGHNIKKDTRLLEDRYGAVVDIIAESSPAYRELLCLVYDALIGGTTELQLRKVLGLLFDIPCANGDETVEAVEQDSRGVFIATDKSIYRTSTSGIPTVKVGQKIKAGDTLFSSMRIHKAAIPAEVTQLTVPKSFLDASIDSDLIFYNRDVLVVRDNDKAQFEIGGDPEAVKRFWALVHARGKINEALGNKTVNPAVFVIHNVLRNALICSVHDDSQAHALSELNKYNVLRLLVPPHAALIINRI